MSPNCDFLFQVCSVPLSARDLEKQTEKEMEKWKRDRPSSTFEPRHRCTGYQMVWAVALQNQQRRERMERETGHLSVPLTRSVSTLSLSPKRWRKGGKVGAGEREGGARVTRHLSMGAKDQRWTEVSFNHSKCVREDEDAETQEPIGKTETEKANLPTLIAEHSEEEPRSPETDASVIREKPQNENQTEETEFRDLTGNHLQPESQSHAPEQKNSRIDAQDETQKHLDANPEPDVEEKVGQSQEDTEKRPHWDTVTEEAENTVQEKHGSTAEVDGLVQTQEDLEPSEHLHSKTEVGEMLVSDHTGSEPSETSLLCFEAAEAIQENVEISLTENAGGEKDETSTQSRITERTPESAASSQDTDDNPPDGKMSSLQTNPPEEPPPEPLEVLGSAGEGRSTETSEGNTVENDFLDFVKQTDSHNEPQGGEVRNSRRSSRSSSDFCIRKSSSSQGSRSGRSLSEDLFTVPQKPSQPPSMESNSGVKHTEPLSNLSGANSVQSPPEVSSVRSAETSRTDQQQETPNPPKGFRLFRKLRGQAPKPPKGAPKIQVPKILIQDFSDGTATEKPVQEYKEEKLNSRERRRRQREQERRTKEEEKLRKKREKEQEKVTEREKRKAQTLGKNVRVQGGKERCDELHPGKHHSHRRKSSTSYAESYF